MTRDAIAVALGTALVVIPLLLLGFEDVCNTVVGFLGPEGMRCY